ncbi:MAG: nuclear transport factor 2 family protein [Chloroflexi bacterium]|nr:nuclear transport factor 2 family protein [Chloroflexota bacterium]
MTERVDAVLAANTRFYLALSIAAAAAMRSVWARADEATCIHPGGHKITGHRNIQQSWAMIFANQGPMRVWPSGARVKFEGDLAWVICVENVDASATEIGKIICVRARNGFCDTADGWKMLHHIAEPMPGREFQPTNHRLATN